MPVVPGIRDVSPEARVAYDAFVASEKADAKATAAQSKLVAAVIRVPSEDMAWYASATEAYRQEADS